MKIPALTLAVLTSLTFAATQSRAQIIANFTDGNGTSLVDQYAGIAGSGWVGAWVTNVGGSNGTFGSPTVAPTVINTSPLNSGGNYLSSAVTTVSGDRTQWNAAVGRQYTSFGGVDPALAHTISFDFRLDSTSGFAVGGDFVGAFGSNSTSTNNFTGSSTWGVRVMGAQQGSIPTLTWAAYDGLKDGGSFSSALLTQIGTGLTLSLGTVYTVTVDLFPSTLSYNVAVTDGVTGVSSTNLGFRANSASSSPSVFFQSQFNTTPTNLGDAATFSVDGVSVIPEPSTFAMLGLGLGMATFLRRRRSTT